MGESNLDLVRRAIADVHEFWAMLDEHVVWDLRAREGVPDLDDIYVGRSEVIRGSRHYWGTWDEYSVEAEELIDAGQSVIVMLRERGLGKRSGAPVETVHPQLWTFREGRIVRWESFQSREEALRAVELPGA